MSPELTANATRNTLCKRIIPCLDIRDGRVVKGIQFESIRDAGNPIELAQLYAQMGADELVFLDITATVEKRKTMATLVHAIATHINIPFTVGGGISTYEDVAVLMQHGADKISVNTAAFKRPALLTEIANRYGSQCAVLAIDTRQEADGKWYVYLNGGRTKTDVLAIDWAITAVNAGAGELLLTAMNNDGEQKGFALDITHQISDAVAVPVIASGGAGTLEHFKDVFTLAHADAALAASIFHFGTIAITDLKQYLINQKIPVRC